MFVVGCTRQLYYEYEFAEETGGEREAIEQNETSGLWAIDGGLYDILIHQASAPNHVRLHIFAVNKKWPHDAGEQERFYAFAMQDYSSCASRAIFFENFAESSSSFLPRSQLDRFDTMESSSPPGLSAILVAEPCQEERGWLDIEVFGPEGNTVGTHRVHLGLRVAHTSWRLFFESAWY